MVDPNLASDGDASRAGLDEEERDAVAVPGLARSTGGHDHGVGTDRVEHLDLLAAQSVAAVTVFRAAVDRVAVVTCAWLLVRERNDPGAVDHRGEPLVLERLVAAERKGRSAHRHATQEGLRRQLAAERLHDQHELREAHARTA